MYTSATDGGSLNGKLWGYPNLVSVHKHQQLEKFLYPCKCHGEKSCVKRKKLYARGLTCRIRQVVAHGDTLC